MAHEMNAAASASFDYIIVGAGAAGCVLANRLSQDPANRVLLIEAGGRDTHPFIHMPKGISKVMADPAYIWNHMTESETGTNNVAESWARGRTLGGSSSINGMVYVRGQAADFNELAAVSSDDWNWSHIGAAYKALESHELGPAPTRGDHGPLHITLAPDRLPLMEAAIVAGTSMGLERKEDVNDPVDVERIGYAPRTIHKGRRQSASVAFLNPIVDRPNLTVITNASVDGIQFKDRRATGVRAHVDGKPVTYFARREVILSAGALSTPALLQRSGIGPADHLQRLEIPLIQDSPQVGRNLREHRGLVMQWRVRDDLSQNREFRGLRLAANTARYYLTYDGPMASGAYEVGAWFKSRPELERPDAQILIAPFTFDFASPTFNVEAQGGMNFCVYMLRPDSTGSLLIRSRDPAALPTINANYCELESDRRKMIDIIRYARRLASQPALADAVTEETRPGPDYHTDEEILQAHIKFGYGSYHACGTCRMGKDEASVVDPRLRVRGVDALRVVDTSVFPFMLSGNTNGPVTAIAWRAADLILEDR
jgi:choline dehydrogenase-like flavoprotein